MSSLNIDLIKLENDIKVFVNKYDKGPIEVNDYDITSISTLISMMGILDEVLSDINTIKLGG